MGGFGVLGEDATRCMVENAVGTFPLPLGEPGACENHQTTREISRGNRRYCSAPQRLRLHAQSVRLGVALVVLSQAWPRTLW